MRLEYGHKRCHGKDDVRCKRRRLAAAVKNVLARVDDSLGLVRINAHDTLTHDDYSKAQSDTKRA
jgi:hypothetical protein